jgi:hypothetical protein
VGHLVIQQSPRKMFAVFQNLSPKLIRGFQHQDNTLHVFLASVVASADSVLMEVKCVDAEKAKELLAAGIGACVSLYNVKVKIGAFGATTLLVTANSGIRLVQLNNESNKKVSNTTVAIEEIRSVEKPLTATKWTCLVCGFRNYASKTVCFSCDLTRKEGPNELIWPCRHVEGSSCSSGTWTCEYCFARKNSVSYDYCWKCDLRRSKKSKKKARFQVQ